MLNYNPKQDDCALMASAYSSSRTMKTRATNPQGSGTRGAWLSQPPRGRSEEKFAAAKPDVLISDIAMPDQDGYALMAK